jgi:hypothetical protein
MCLSREPGRLVLWSLPGVRRCRGLRGLASEGGHDRDPATPRGASRATASPSGPPAARPRRNPGRQRASTWPWTALCPGQHLALDSTLPWTAPARTAWPSSTRRPHRTRHVAQPSRSEARSIRLRDDSHTLSDSRMTPDPPNQTSCLGRWDRASGLIAPDRPAGS